MILLKYWLLNFVCVALLIVPVLGCGGDEEPEPQPKPKPAAPKPKPVEKPKPVAKPAKPVEEEEKLVAHVKVAGLSEETIESPQCFATLTAGVLQIRNHAPGNLAAPSVFFWARVDAKDFASLADQTIDARMYVLASKETQPWHAAGDGTVKVKFTKVTDTMLVGEAIDAELVDSGSGRHVQSKCEFVAQLQ